MKHTKHVLTGTWVPVVAGAAAPDDLVGERMFVPDPLPSEIEFSAATVWAAAAAQEQVARLDEAVRRLGDPGNLVLSAQVREARGTAEFDGDSMSLREVLVSRLDPAQANVPPGVGRYLGSADLAFTSLRRRGRIEVERLAEAAALLAGTSVEQVWRAEHAWVGGPSRRMWLAPPADAQPRVALVQLLTWLHAVPDMMVIARSALCLYQCELSAPFAQVSGHVSRMLVALELTRSGLLCGQLLPISPWIERNRVEYHQHLRATVDSGDPQPWIRFVADAIRDIAEGEIALVKELEAIRDRLVAKLSNRNIGAIRSVVDHIVTTPITNINSIVKLHNVSRSRADEIARKLRTYSVLQTLNDARYAKIVFNREALNVHTFGVPPDDEAGGSWTR